MRLPTVVRLECKVRGCGAEFEVPIVYRDVPITMPGTLAEPDERVVGTRLEVDVDATLALEAWTRGHLEQHALEAELLAAGHPDDPGPELVEVSLEPDPDLVAEPEEEPEGWRTP